MVDMTRYGAGPVRVEDVRDGPRQEKILSASINERFDCPELTFVSGGSFLLNNRNTGTLNRAFGSESDGWIGKTIELSLGRYTDNRDGQEKETVVVRAISVRQLSADNGGMKQPPPPPPRSARRDDLVEEEPPF